MADSLDDRTKKTLTALGEHLRETRERLGISQLVLAQRIGMDPPNYLKIERGKKNVTVETLLRIADGLGVDLSVRFGPTAHRRQRDKG